MHEPLITSLLDTDLYKFTMMQCIWHHFKEVNVSYHLQFRKPIDLKAIASQVEVELAHLCQLQFSEEELTYLQSLPYFKADYIDFLRGFRLNKAHVHLQSGDQLDLRLQGPWVETILFEIPLLAILAETYYRTHFPEASLEEGKKKLQEKITYLQNPDYAGFTFCEFGTRRRFSKTWQDILLTTLKTALPSHFTGTSNVYFAKQLGLRPIGTMAHEFLQACQVLAPQIETSQAYALRLWLKEYPHALGIALTDVLTTDLFLKEFDYDLATRYAGLRHDSGDPFVWGEKAIEHYRALGIDPETKMLVFSDRLTLPKATAIYAHFKGKIQTYFGIGTTLTNDVGYDPLDIVIKMTHTNDKPVIKISDTPGKLVCEDKAYLGYIKKVFHLEK